MFKIAGYKFVTRKARRQREHLFGCDIPPYDIENDPHLKITELEVPMLSEQALEEMDLVILQDQEASSRQKKLKEQQGILQSPS